jgi:hypothetical protein
MFGLMGFAECDTEGCLTTATLQIGLTPGNLLRVDAQQLVPDGWQMKRELASNKPLAKVELKIYCPECVEKQNEEARRGKLTVVSS